MSEASASELRLNPKRIIDAYPEYILLALVLFIGLLGIPLATWVTLTVAGIGMGLMIFVMASGMTLTFGLMDVLNLGHGALITVGAFLGATMVTGFETGLWPLKSLVWLKWTPAASAEWTIGALALSLLLAGFAAMLLAARRANAGATYGAAAALGLLCLLALYVWTWSGNFVTDIGIVAPAFLLAFIGVGVVGYVFERLIIRPVYGDPLKQILVTVGAAYIIGELLKAFWGADLVPMTKPAVFEGGFTLGNVTVEKYRLLATVIGLAIFWLLNRIINKTKIGLLIRAGVENVEMVEALGYRIRLLFILVFVAGAALAGVGGVMWGLYQGSVGTGLGAEMLILIIIVIIIGGKGSIIGCFYGAILVGLLDNYTIYMFPKVALFSSIGLMVLVLMWRPEGLKPVK